jgi:hypothetical protein
MILPTKRLSTSRSLIYVGAELLIMLRTPKSVNQLWKSYSSKSEFKKTITFDWFNLALDFLFVLGLIELSNGQLKRVSK